MPRNMRDYGLGDATPYTTGKPKVIGPALEADGPLKCPNCGCELFHIETELKDYPLLKPGKQVGHYLGCPACPWASPMVAVSLGK